MENNIQFDEFKIRSRIVLGQSESPAMIQSMVKHGVVKNEKQAFFILIFFIMLMISSSVFIIYNGFFKQTPLPTLSPEEELLLNPQTQQ